MRFLRSILSSQLMAVVMAVSVSVCCCTSQYVLRCLMDSGAGQVVVDSGHACCSGDAPFVPADSRNGNRSSPDVNCGCCCVKGTVQSGVQLEIPDAPVLTQPMLRAESFDAAMQPFQTRHDFAARDPEPQTLVRMHCALIV